MRALFSTRALAVQVSESTFSPTFSRGKKERPTISQVEERLNIVIRVSSSSVTDVDGGWGDTYSSAYLLCPEQDACGGTEVAPWLQRYLWPGSAQTFRELSTWAPVFAQLSISPREKAVILVDPGFVSWRQDEGKLQQTDSICISLVVNLGPLKLSGVFVNMQIPSPCLKTAELESPDSSFSRHPGLPWCLRWWKICLQCRRPGFDPWVGKIPWRTEWQPTALFLPGKSHGQRNLVG